MNDFDYDCLQKKRLARQASHKKGGSKSRRCPMSTDYMTEKQWKERNGEVVSIRFNKPASWDTFKMLSKTTQEEYLKGLAAAYGANGTNIAEMLGVDARTFRRYIQSSGLDIRFPVGHSMNGEQRAAWEAFLGADNAQSACEEGKEPHSEPEQERRDEDSMLMEQFSVSFSGSIDAGMIARYLERILGESTVCHVDIVCKMGGGGIFA